MGGEGVKELGRWDFSFYSFGKHKLDMTEDIILEEKNVATRQILNLRLLFKSKG